MSGRTKIDWATRTWNVTTGCSKVSEGCRNCYAERMAWRLANHPSETVGGAYRDVVAKGADPDAVPLWTGEVNLLYDELTKPLHWKKPQRIFVNSMSDLFHEAVPSDFIAAVFGVMAACPQHTFMVLTKRPGRMREWFARAKSQPLTNGNGYTVIQGAALDLAGLFPVRSLGGHCIRLPFTPHNIWIGVSVEDQATADERIPLLLATPAAKRFVSLEPCLGPVDFRYLQPRDPPTEIDSLNGTHGVLRPHGGACDKLSWVIMGCESGPNARPMDLDWARSVRDQCSAARVPFFLKQLPGPEGKLVKMPALDGVVHDATPEEKP